MGNKEQIYGRNDMVILDKHNKIYGSLGIIEPYVFDTKTGETIIMENPKKGKFEDAVTEFSVYGKSTQVTTTGAQLFDASYEHNIIDIGNYWGDTRTIVGKNVLEWTSYTDNPNTSRPFYCYPIHPNKEYVITYNNFGIRTNWYIGLADGNGIGTRDLIVFENRVQIPFISGENDTYLVMNLTNSFELMLNEGGTVKPYEPYTGGKPSPSIEYPQEIVSAGDKGSINVDVDNNGYIQKGTYFDNIRSLPLARGYTYHIEGDTKGNNINCFVFNEINESLRNSANLYDYGYGSKQLKAINNTGVVDNECRFPVDYKNGYTFEVTVDGLYLYQGINHRNLDSNDFYIGHHANIVDEEYKKQTLTIKTPNGLLGIPVSTGGNYTDSNGKQWVCDEIDLARGKYIQRVNKAHIIPQDVEFLNIVNTYEKCDVLICKLIYKYPSIINNSFYTPIKADKYRQYTGNWNDGVGMITSNYGNIYITVEKGVTTIEETDIAYILQTPIERDLSPEEIQAYKALHTNYPTTVIMNDENAGMKVTYKQLESKTRVVN